MEVIFFKRHLCPDWDYLEIGPGDAAWENGCVCKYFPEPKDFEKAFDGDNKGEPYDVKTILKPIMDAERSKREDRLKCMQCNQDINLSEIYTDWYWCFNCKQTFNLMRCSEH